MDKYDVGSKLGCVRQPPRAISHMQPYTSDMLRVCVPDSLLRGMCVTPCVLYEQPLTAIVCGARRSGGFATVYLVLPRPNSAPVSLTASLRPEAVGTCAQGCSSSC